ncbi:cytochrome P450 [Cellulomonas sp. SG140]|uniref:cytochrome P450 n=1 Tax=Cellulomonas sp. SG140 TaxID=2976536 RepID=UPI0021E9602D|nr:cytochrome P450 [Cellulomonas sp. SG140]
MTLDEAMDRMFAETQDEAGVYDDEEFDALEDFLSDPELTNDDIVTLAVIEAGLDV